MFLNLLIFGKEVVMKVTVNKDICVGSGSCQANCPEIFEVVDGKSQVKADPSTEEQKACARQAVEGCPVGAISAS
jgi:ferredoxin